MKKGKHEKGEATKMIFDRLEKGPATPKQLEDELGLPHNTIMDNLRDSLLSKLKIFKQLQDGTYALKWYSPEEDNVKSPYNSLERKLLRPPTPKELSSYIKRTPDEAKPLLFKYIPGYREPTEEEIDRSAKDLWMLLVCGCFDLTAKKAWFEDGIVEVLVDGVDGETLNEILEGKPSADFDKAKKYLEEFSQLKPEITETRMGSRIIYRVNWSEEVKRILFAMDLWHQSAEILIPFKYDNDNEYPFGDYEYPWGSFEVSEHLAANHVLSPRVMAHFLRFIGLPRHESRVLATLKKFCQNAIEVSCLDEDVKEKIALKLKDVAFVRDYKNLQRDYEKPSDAVKERNDAFDIIEFLNLRNKEIIDIARMYIDEIGSEGFEEKLVQGPDMFKVAIWLARDSQLESEIIKSIYIKLQDPYYQRCSGILAKLLNDIRIQNYELTKKIL